MSYIYCMNTRRCSFKSPTVDDDDGAERVARGSNNADDADEVTKESSEGVIGRAYKNLAWFTAGILRRGPSEVDPAQMV